MAIDWTQDANCELAWLFDTDASPVEDSSGNGNTGTITDSTYATASPAAAYSVGYYTHDGGGSYILGSISGYSRSAGDPQSMVVWAKPNATQVNAGSVVMGIRDGSGAGDLTRINYNGTTDTFSAEHDVTGSGTSIIASSSSPTAEWEHVASVYDSSNLLIYLDGVLKGTSASIPNAAIDQTTFASAARADSPLTEEFTGDIDELALFSSSLDSTDISDIMDNGLAGTQFYTSGDVAALPADDTDLENQFATADYTTVSTDDGNRVAQTATGEYAIFQFKDKHTNNTDSITVTWNGQSDLAPSSSPVILEIYNHGTSEWDELDRDSTTAANTDFTLTGSK